MRSLSRSSINLESGNVPGEKPQRLPPLMSDEQLIAIAGDEATDAATLRFVSAEIVSRLDRRDLFP